MKGKVMLMTEVDVVQTPKLTMQNNNAQVEIYDDYCKAVSAEEISVLLKKVTKIIAEAQVNSVAEKIT